MKTTVCVTWLIRSRFDPEELVCSAWASSLLTWPHSPRRGELSFTCSLSFGTLLKRQNKGIKHCWVHHLLCLSTNQRHRRIRCQCDCLRSVITFAAVAVEQGNTWQGKTPEDRTGMEILCILVGSFFCLISAYNTFSIYYLMNQTYTYAKKCQTPLDGCCPLKVQVLCDEPPNSWPVKHPESKEPHVNSKFGLQHI